MTFLIPLISSLVQTSEPPISIRVEADRPANAVHQDMYGVFFEEINQAGEGGLYAEMLRTRGMEGGSATKLPIGWKAVGSESAVKPVTDSPDPSRPISISITRSSATEKVGAANEGFWGVAVKARESYRVTLWVKSDVPVDVALVDAAGNSIGKTTVKVEKPGWNRVQAGVRATKSDTKASFVVSPSKPGTTQVAFASLMPFDLWKRRDNGFRRDLASHIESMKPGFVRFPGGCFIEGNTLPQAFDWRGTLGPVETRTGMGQSFWGYPISNGLGYHEYLQWCEDMGARGMFVANCGMSHQQVAPMADMGRYVQDALDAIEYARGPVTSKYGAMRAKNGHPKPFDLHYVEIGNENGGPAYDERYALMAKAIKAKYPDIELIACVWGGTPKSHPLELIDEHYYNSPDFFWRNSDRYDGYDRKGPKVYVGEYAVTRGCGTGNLAAALGEAAFMTGMERNSDVVHMASYAPLLVNVNNRQWNPNAIVFDNARSYGTPSYWVQWLFANNVPTKNVRYQVQKPRGVVMPLTGTVGLTTWKTSAEYKDIKLEADGKVVYDSAKGVGQLERPRGDWKVENGVISQTTLEEDRHVLLKSAALPTAQKVTLSLKAKKIRGAEGFIIVFGSSPDRVLQWNLGGWTNSVHAFQVNDGRTGNGVEAKIEEGRWYDIRLEREGDRTRGYLDGKLIEEIVDEPVTDFAAVAGIDEAKNEIVIKAVNGRSVAREAVLNIRGANLGKVAKGTVLKGNALLDENSLTEPNKIRPESFTLGGVSSRMTIKLAPYSVTVLRIPRSK